MPRTYAQNLGHCVYGTKNCVELIRDPQQVWRLTREIARNTDIDIIEIGGVKNHVRFLMVLPPATAMANKGRSFQNKYIEMLERAGIAYDRRYVWEERTPFRG